MAAPVEDMSASAQLRNAEDPEKYWLEHVYQGDVPQLTFRAVGTGLVLGALMSFSNIYIVLRTGWMVGVAISACFLAFSFFRAGRALGLLKTEPTILEVNCLQSTASAAGYSTASTLGSVFCAYLLITGKQVPMVYTLPLVFFLAMLGVFMAVPMKRAMINREQLVFPSGTAAAELLRSLYTTGGEAVGKARALLYALAAGAALGWFRDGMQGLAGKLKELKSPLADLVDTLSLPNFVPLPRFLRGGTLYQRLDPIFDHKGYGFALELSTLLAAAGALVGFRTSWSLALGALVNYGAIAPWMHGWADVDSTGAVHHVIETLGYRGIVSWSVWPGVAALTAAALLNFALQGGLWTRAAKAVRDIFVKRGQTTAREDLLASIELPTSWFVVGFTVSAIGCVVVNVLAFHIAAWLVALAVLISFVLAIVACRSTGETDVTPLTALGKITQLTYGVLIPQNMTANLMTANVTASVAASSADLLNDLKSGYLLGANPRRQFIAQFCGVFVGAAVTVPVFYFLVPNAQAIGNDHFPVPTAQVWKAVAELLAKGVHSLHPTAMWGLGLGALVGVLLTLLERAFPKAKPFIPSPTGFGLAFVLPNWSCISFFIGGLAAWMLERRDKALADRLVVPVASGLLVGESLMGVAVALLAAFGILSS